MGYLMRGVGGSDDRDINNSNEGKRSLCKDLRSYQTTILEEFMKENQHPDEIQRNQLAKEVGLEPKQIMFWFQNKRDDLKITPCSTCGGPTFPTQEHELYLQKMRKDNDRLKEKIEKLSTLVARYEREEISQSEFEEALVLMNAFSRL